MTLRSPDFESGASASFTTRRTVVDRIVSESRVFAGVDCSSLRKSESGRVSRETGFTPRLLPCVELVLVVATFSFSTLHLAAQADNAATPRSPIEARGALEAFRSTQASTCRSRLR